MRRFDELSPVGRTRRLRTLALDTLQHGFAVDAEHVRPVAVHSFNTVFRADAPDGATPRMALRVGDRIRIHAADVESVEAAWLCRLSAETALTVPQPVAGRDGCSSRHWSVPGVDGTRVCSLFSWLDGRPLRDHMTTDGLVSMGRVAAELHEHAASLDAAFASAAPCADAPVYFGETDLVTSPGADPLLVEARARVQDVIDGLWADPPHRPHLLHGDIGPHNVLVFRGRVRPIDFQDLLVGFDVQDVAITVADLRRNAPEAVEPFRSGYRSVRPWPLSDPALEAALVAGRSLNVANLGLLLRRDGFDRRVAAHTAIVRRWMTSA